MKNLKTIALMSSLLFTSTFSLARAEDVELVVIAKPAILDEGTQRELSAAQIAELLPWAKDSKNFLVDLLENVQGLTTTDRVERLAEGIKSVVADSAPKNSELLMRYALNRALAITTILDNEMDGDTVGTIDAKSRVLVLSIKMALKYYDADMATLSSKTASPFASFGKEYFTFLTELNKSIFDASAQYAIQRTSLEWLQWDLYRDLNNASYAAQIVKINNALKTFPTRKISDAQSISYIRQMKKVSESLNILEKREPIVSERITEVKQEEKPRDNGRYRYSTSSSKCYPLSANGDMMYSSPASDDSCFSGKFHYSTSSSRCYKMSTTGDVMYSSPVSDTSCFSGKYHYSTSSSKCYKTAASGDVMYSSPTNDDYCASGKYYYSSSSSSCYKQSLNGDVMYSSKVSDNLCR